MRINERYIPFYFYVTIPFVFIFHLASQCNAGVYEYKYSPPSLIDSEGYAHYKIIISDSLYEIKGIYFNLPGWQGSSLHIVDDPAYKTYAAAKGFALMGAQMLGKYTHYLDGISQWSGETTITALKELSKISGHSEIEYAPILFDGHSAGGQFAYHFTQWKPERVIAFVTVKGGYHSLSPAGEAIKVPGYLFIGENDRDYRIENLTTIFENHRSQGALWTLAKEPNAGHSRVSKELVFSYFNAVIPLRFTSESPTNDFPQLLEIDETIGWLGNRTTYQIAPYTLYNGDKSQACWFPSEKIAVEWRNFVTGSSPSYIEEISEEIPYQYSLYQNYPNPFNPTTNIQYTLGKPSLIQLNIYNIRGKKIKTLVKQFQGAGNHSVVWDATDDQGHKVSSGIYFYEISTPEFKKSKKMLLLQ